jgi:hypothetical protein
VQPSQAGPPTGHGFTTENLRLDTAYYVYDLPGIRFVGLDTTRLTGTSDGALDLDQLWWLQARLAEVHSTYRAADGTTMVTEAEDKLVVLFSHHGTDALTNPRGAPTETGDPVGATELLELLHRFPNLVLWLNGHTHTNAVRPRIDPLDAHRGFWEVTTSALVDWPCQTRLVELIDLADGAMAIACTMVDHDSQLGPLTHGDVLNGAEPATRQLTTRQLTTRQLAALHRELPQRARRPAPGRPAHDRNVVLPLRAPFDLSRLRWSPQPTVP